MKSPKNFQKIAIFEMWLLVSFWGVKTHFGEIPLKWCIIRNDFFYFHQYMICLSKPSFRWYQKLSSLICGVFFCYLLLLMISLCIFFFRQKLKHKLQWQLLMPILTWTIPTKNTKNARNKFWAKEWKIRCTSTTTWTNLKFLIPVLWSKDGFLKFQSLASRDYPTGDNNCGRFTDQLPTCSCPRSYWMPPLIIFFGEAFSFHTEFSTDFVTCRIYIKLAHSNANDLV